MTTSQHLSSASGSSINTPMASPGSSAGWNNFSMAGHTKLASMAGRSTPPEIERPVPFGQDVLAMQVSSGLTVARMECNVRTVVYVLNTKCLACSGKSIPRSCASSTYRFAFAYRRKLCTVSLLGGRNNNYLLLLVVVLLFFCFFIPKGATERGIKRFEAPSLSGQPPKIQVTGPCVCAEC